MKKIFVIDTNVLLHNPESIFHFGENTVLVPMICLEEIDMFKKDQTETGRNARRFSRIVDGLRKKGSLSEGIKLLNGGLFKIVLHKKNEEQFGGDEFDMSKNDNFILGAAVALKEKGNKVIIVTKDINLRLKADVFGIKSEDFSMSGKNIEELYSGQFTAPVDKSNWEKFREKKEINLKDLGISRPLNPNQYVFVENEKDKKSIIGRYSFQSATVKGLRDLSEGIWGGIYPKNDEQHCALDALLDDSLKLVTLVGKAGTGKTLLAVAAGLERTVVGKQYSRVLVSRPIWPMGKDLGYLPGDIDDKIGPWMRPIYDALDFLFEKRGKEKVNTSGKNASKWSSLVENGLLHVEPLTYIRGRSIPKQFIIIDESQNLTPHEIKTIITRVGEDSKIILTGDCEQIDNPYLDSVNNGLAYCIERLKGQEFVGHTTLKVGERSSLAEVASKLL